MTDLEQAEVQHNKAIRGYIIRCLVKGFNNTALTRQISNSMMAAGLAGVIEASPASNPDTLTAFATISNVISSAITVYLGIFITIPLSNLIYKVMKRKGVPS